MINIYNFEKSLKLCWMKKLLLNKTKGWTQILSATLGGLNKLYFTGGHRYLKKCSLNPFWQTVFRYWDEFCSLLNIEKIEDVMTSSIWLNPQVTRHSIFFGDWFKHGIHLIPDIVNEEGAVLGLDILEKRYKFKINFLNYITIKKYISDFLTAKKYDETYICMKPSVPFHIRSIIGSVKETKIFYNTFTQKNEKMVKIVQKWNLDLAKNWDSGLWKIVYKICFFTIDENVLKWFQYKVIRRILGTNVQLKKTRISSSDLCRICGQHSESLVHIFYECDQVKELWLNVKTWITSKLGINIDLDITTKMLGYTVQDENFWPLNFVILCVKYHIFLCAQSSKNVNIFQVQLLIKSKYEEQEMLSKLNNFYKVFSKRWLLWQNLFMDL